VPRELVRAPGHDRGRSLGWLALKWLEHFCVHGPGDVQGRQVDLSADMELSGFLVDAYALDEAGRRLYDSAFLSRPKGRDKSGMAARVALLETFGPARFAGWAEGGEVFGQLDFRYVYEPGEPLGRPVASPFVRVLATEEQQSAIAVYDAIYYNLKEGPLKEAPGVDAGLTRTFTPGGGEIRPSTASSAAKDGGRETFAVFDETHLYVLPELRRMYATVRRNLAKRRGASPWSLEVSTMYAPGLNSVAEATHALARQIQAGKARQARLLFDHRQGSAEVDLDDEAALRAALSEAYGDFAAAMDLDRLVAEVQDPRNDEADSRRYFLNLAVPMGGQLLERPEQWTRLASPAAVPAGEPITLGFDGSLRQDATALRGCTRDGYLFTLGVWERPPGAAGDGWQVPEAEVDAAVDAAFQRYRVLLLYADPAWWGSWVATWAGRYGHERVVERWGNQELRIAREVREIHTAILGGDLRHDGDPAVARHWRNAHKRPIRSRDEDGTPLFVLCKARPGSPDKIDAAMADTFARSARNDALARGLFKVEPALPPPEIF
jgi:hypothetical protein